MSLCWRKDGYEWVADFGNAYWRVWEAPKATGWRVWLVFPVLEINGRAERALMFESIMKTAIEAKALVSELVEQMPDFAVA